MNKYLEKVALTRLVKEIAKGAVSAAPENLSRLASQGALRGAKTYERGMLQGNKALSKIHNVVHTAAPAGKNELGNMLAHHGGGHMSLPLMKGPTLALSLPKKESAAFIARDKNTVQGFIRHEIHEGAEYRHGLKDGSPRIPRSTVRKGYDQWADSLPGTQSEHLEPKVRKFAKALGPETVPTVLRKTDAKGVSIHGAHRNLAVLGRESNDLRSNPYLGRLKSLRQESGEGDLVSKLTGKKFGVDKMGNKDLAKLRAAPSHTEMTPSGSPAKMVDL